MKLVLRIFALSIVVAGGVAAATTTTKASAALPNHQSATASMPAPCGGGHMQCEVNAPQN